MKHLNFISPVFCSIVLGSGIFAVSPAVAQSDATGTKLVSEGIAGYADSKRRAPVLTVSVERNSGGIKLLADAFLILTDYRDYPIRFEFFLNRQLFATQYRSPGLNGPVGVDIGPDSGKPPFNFSVVATVIHPNRTFSSVVEGAVFASDLLTTFESCTVTQTTGSGDTEQTAIFVGQKVATTQSGNETVGLTFKGVADNGDGELSVAATLTVDGERVSGSATTSDETADSSKSTELTGSAVSTNGTLSELDLASADSALTLKCS